MLALCFDWTYTMTERVKIYYVCTGLRISTKNKKLVQMTRVGDPQETVLVDGKQSRSLGGVYSIEHPADDLGQYYTDSIMWSHAATKADSSGIDMDAAHTADMQARAFFERRTQQNATKRLEKDMSKDLADYTLKEIASMSRGFTGAERRAMVTLVMEKMGLF